MVVALGHLVPRLQRPLLQLRRLVSVSYCRHSRVLHCSSSAALVTGRECRRPVNMDTTNTIDNLDLNHLSSDLYPRFSCKASHRVISS